MSEYSYWFSRRHREGLISAISAGFFFVLVGAIFITTPSLFERIFDFFRDFGIVTVPNMAVIYWIAPRHPWTHIAVYTALQQFSYIWGFFQMVILALRFVARSPVSKKAETAGNLVFWLGAGGYLIGTFLKETTTKEMWFAFWATIIMLIGLSLIVRAIILAATYSMRATRIS